MFDLVHRLSIVQSTPSQAVTNGNTVTNGAGSSIVGYESLSALMRISSRTDGTYTPKIQLSADNVTFYDADAASYIGGAAPGSQNAVGDTLIGLQFIASAAAVAGGVASPTSLIFARVAVTQAGGTTGATFQTDLILGHPRHSGVAV